jgi:hypothetical protein
MFTCFIRYRIEPDKLDEFREYARAWVSLIRKYGGTHHGYFVPGTDGDDLPNPAFSFPGIGTEGPPNIVLAFQLSGSIQLDPKGVCAQTASLC